VAAAAPTQNSLPPLVHHDSQLRKTEATATDAAEMNKNSSSAPSDNATSPQRHSAADDTSDGTPASMSSEKRNGHDDRTRKSSSVDQELAREKSARSNKRKLCSADGCTNIVLRGGVCIRHGANKERCSYEWCTNTNSDKRNAHTDRKPKSSSVDEELAREKRALRKKYRYECSADGCTNRVRKGGVCIRHGAKVKRCSIEGCNNHAKIGGVCDKHGAKRKTCSSEACTNQAQIGGVCIRHGAKVKLCSSEGCTNQATKGGVCKRHDC
jgi:hypothetical protein